MSKITNDHLTRSCTGCFYSRTHVATVGVKGLNSLIFPGFQVSGRPGITGNISIPDRNQDISAEAGIITRSKYNYSLRAMRCGDDVAWMDDAGTAHVVDLSSDHQPHTTLPRPRVTPSLHAADDASQRHLRMERRVAAVAGVGPRLWTDVYTSDQTEATDLCENKKPSCRYDSRLYCFAAVVMRLVAKLHLPLFSRYSALSILGSRV